jgi:DNA-binding HxlR family transcriptional regulator
MSKRSYQQNCALARAGDVIGERWTLLMVRDLLVAPRRFNELLASLKGMGTNLLAERLKYLEGMGIIERAGARGAYSLTAKGYALEPAVLALIRWGLLHGPENRPGDHHRHDWDLLALKSAFQPDRADGMSLTVSFDCDALQGWVRIEDQMMMIGLGQTDAADITIAGTVSDLFLGDKEPRALISAGSPEDMQRFVAAFALRA